MRKKRCGRLWGRLPAVLLSGACLASLMTGCGETPEAPLPQVTLLEPVGVGESYETAARRNLYDANVYNGLICPYTEECSLKSGMNFHSYTALPGDEVSKGQTLLRTNVENLETQIEDMEKTIARNEKEFLEYCRETEEALEKQRGDESFWGQVVENWTKAKPEEPAAWTEDRETAYQLYREKYEQWERENQNQGYERRYRNALIARQKLEEQLKQRTELYELDAEYNRLLLQRLREERDNSTVLSTQKGVVANIRFLSRNEYMNAGRSMAAVADLNQKLLKCDFINKAQIGSAKQVFAVIGGTRYEVEYEPMESEEYKRLEEENGKVYTTFYLPEEAAGVEIGSYAVVVVINEVRENVLSVPKDAVGKEEDGSYVYVLKDGERVYTPVVTGMQDGVYTEILSGLEEGDRVLTEKDAPTVGKTVFLESGSVSHEFTAQGTLVYPVQEWVGCPDIQGTVYFGELLVNLYQQVKKGDVLFTIRVKGDQVELERQERTLQRQRERLAELEKDSSEENQKAIEQMRETVAELEKQLAELKADYGTEEVKAPYDGIIVDMSTELWVNTLKEGDLLQRGQRLLVVAEQGTDYIAVEDPNGLLSYGNEAEIEYTGSDGGMRTTAGTVVTLNQAAVSADLFGEGYALIRVSPEDAAEMAGSAFNSDGWWSLSRFGVTVTTREMENVVIVPKKAVLSYGGTTYVKLKQQDGTVLYQSFVAGGSDNENYWVAQGLTEGMEVCIE
ncbi:MAG: hypothetical protein NC123_07685 [Butyrivibrio sp.]|nr:hypothetical protein [Acetatifactor muris]MCM1559412.1 hypothetical protein [Butyrivibrio sp.]